MTYESFDAAGIKLSATALREKGQYKTSCPSCSGGAKHKGKKDLSVNVATGVFRCWNPGCGFIGNIREKVIKKTYSRPAPLKVPTQLDTQWVQWFSERGISQLTLRKMGVLTYKGKEKTAVVFPFIQDGNLIFYKYRFFNKSFMTSKEAEMIFYNLDSIKGKSEVIITEGEVDALTWVENGLDEKYGIISVPNGANIKGGELEYFDRAAKLLSHVKKFYIAVDDDEAGEILKEELCRRIGKDKCLIVKYLHKGQSFKDVNDLHKSIKDVANRKAIISDCLKSAAPYPIQGVFRVDDSSVTRKINDVWENGRQAFDKVGWATFDNHCSFNRNGGFTAISGPPNVGKSDFIFNISVALAAFHGWKFGILSPETGEPDEIIESLFMIYSNKVMQKDVVKEEEKNEILAWINEHFIIMDDVNMVNLKLETFLEIGRQLVYDYGVNCIVADPYNNFENAFSGNGGNDMSSYLNFQFTQVRSFTRKNNCHVIFGTHPKVFDLSKPMGIYDLNGGAAWANKSDNLIFLRRLYQEKTRGEENYKNGIGDDIEVTIKKIKKRYAGRVGQVIFKYNVLTGVMGETAHFKGVRQRLIEQQIDKQYEEDVPF